MLSDKDSAYGHKKSPYHYSCRIKPVIPFFVELEQGRAANGKAERVGGVGGEKTEIIPSGFKHTQTALKHISAIARTQAAYAVFD